MQIDTAILFNKPFSRADVSNFTNILTVSCGYRMCIQQLCWRSRELSDIVIERDSAERLHSPLVREVCLIIVNLMELDG